MAEVSVSTIEFDSEDSVHSIQTRIRKHRQKIEDYESKLVKMRNQISSLQVELYHLSKKSPGFYRNKMQAEIEALSKKIEETEKLTAVTSDLFHRYKSIKEVLSEQQELVHPSRFLKNRVINGQRSKSSLSSRIPDVKKRIPHVVDSAGRYSQLKSARFPLAQLGKRVKSVKSSKIESNIKEVLKRFGSVDSREILREILFKRLEKRCRKKQLVHMVMIEDMLEKKLLQYRQTDVHVLKTNKDLDAMQHRLEEKKKEAEETMKQKKEFVAVFSTLEGLLGIESVSDSIVERIQNITDEVAILLANKPPVESKVNLRPKLRASLSQGIVPTIESVKLDDKIPQLHLTTPGPEKKYVPGTRSTRRALSPGEKANASQEMVDLGMILGNIMVVKFSSVISPLRDDFTEVETEDVEAEDIVIPDDCESELKRLITELDKMKDRILADVTHSKNYASTLLYCIDHCEAIKPEDLTSDVDSQIWLYYLMKIRNIMFEYDDILSLCKQSSDLAASMSLLSELLKTDKSEDLVTYSISLLTSVTPADANTSLAFLKLVRQIPRAIEISTSKICGIISTYSGYPEFTEDMISIIPLLSNSALAYSLATSYRNAAYQAFQRPLNVLKLTAATSVASQVVRCVPAKYVNSIQIAVNLSNYIKPHVKKSIVPPISLSPVPLLQLNISQSVQPPFPSNPMIQSRFLELFLSLLIDLKTHTILCDPEPHANKKPNILFPLISLIDILPEPSTLESLLSFPDHKRFLRLSAPKLFTPELYSNGTHIASGAFGTVMRINDLAVKILRKETSPTDSLRMPRTFAEVSLLDLFRGDQRVTQLIDYGCTSDAYYLVMKYYPSTLKKWIQTFPSFKSRLCVYRETILCCFSLPEKRVLHLDIKCDNVMLSKDGKPCLADFGEAVYLGDLRAIQIDRGTERNKSPEMLRVNRLKSDKYDRRRAMGVGYPSDVWSLGCMFYELIVGEYLFSGQDFVSFYGRVTDDNEKLLSDHNTSKLQDKRCIEFLESVLQREERVRPDFPQVLSKFDEIFPEARDGDFPLFE